MDWKWLYTEFDGRIGRKTFWIGAIVLAIASIIVTLIVTSIMGVSMFGTAMMTGDDADAMLALSTRMAWINLVIYLIFCYPGYALGVKRRHDRGASGILILVSIGLGILSLLLQGFGLIYDVVTVGETAMLTPNILGTIISAASGILGLYLLVVMGFLKGEQGANAYGPDPLAADD